jgi:hypothetical protein
VTGFEPRIHDVRRKVAEGGKDEARVTPRADLRWRDSTRLLFLSSIMRGGAPGAVAAGSLDGIECGPNKSSFSGKATARPEDGQE